MVLNREKLARRIWYLLVFGFVYLWFSQIHPLVLFDSDDWSFVSYIRRGVPLWGDWNPARVLPETLMPMVCSAAVHLLYPLTGDYSGAVTAGSAVTVSLFITAYVYCFAQMMKRVFSLSSGMELVSSGLFLLLHFLALRSEESGNQYLFYCWDLTCYYFYLIPSLLNGSLVMYMTKNDGFADLWNEEGNWLKKGLFLLLVYLAVFSNLPSAGILAAFAGCRVLFALLGQLRNRTSLRSFLKDTALYLGILVLWLSSAVFELSGGRAGAAGGVGLLQSVKKIVEYLSHPTVYCAKAFLAFSILVLLAAAVLWLANWKKDRFGGVFSSQFALLLVCGAALLVYEVLLMAVVDWSSVYRSEYLFGLFFYLLLLVMSGFCYILDKCPQGMLAVPVLLYVLLTCTNTTGQTFKESNMDNYPADVCAQITNDLVAQFVQADQEGAEHLQLLVPVFPKEMNWPLFNGYNGFAIADSLYEHGVTTRRLDFTSEAVGEMNEKYQLHLFE